jgi:signal transduction histidine kinase
MQIRTRLTLQFLLSGGAIMVIASVAIFYASVGFRHEDFYNRLTDKARNTAKLFLVVHEMNAALVNHIQNENPVKFHNERIIILNAVNDTLYTTDSNRDIELKNEILGQVRAGVKTEYIQEPYEVVGIPFTAGSDQYVVMAAATDPEGSIYLSKLRIILVIVCFISLLLFFISGWLYSGKALKPMSDVVKKVEEITITSLDLRISEGKGTDEIGRLAKTFNNMLERLETAFAVQKVFIANASHELRTPLTSINGQLEVLMMKERSTTEYKNALASVLDDIRSLIDLSNRLLLIARTSAEGPMNFSQKIRIDETVWQVREEILRFNPGYQIHISIDPSLTDYDQMLVAGDESLLRVAVSNIIDNACKYSADHKVHVKLQHIENQIGVIFEDRGIGISTEDISRIYEPFYRGANALTHKGTGIGLPLVNQIIKNHNGDIEIASEINVGTIVTVLLPVNRMEMQVNPEK